MITLVFMCLITFTVLIALESSYNTFSKVMAEIEFCIFGNINASEDLTIFKNEAKVQAEKATIIKYGRIIAQKHFEEIEQKIIHHINLINQINTPTPKPKQQEKNEPLCMVAQMFYKAQWDRIEDNYDEWLHAGGELNTPHEYALQM